MQTSEILLKLGGRGILVNPWLTKRSFFWNTQIKRGFTYFCNNWLQAQAEVLKYKLSGVFAAQAGKLSLRGKGLHIKVQQSLLVNAGSLARIHCK